MPTFEAETGAGSATATSYCAVAVADDYHSMHPMEATWTALTTEQKQERLMMATAMLDARANWRGAKYVVTSALRWPRAGILDRDGQAISETTIPTRLKWATAELARQLGTSVALSGDTRSARSKATGPVSITYDGAGRSGVDGLPVEVAEWVREFVTPRSGSVVRA